MLDGRLEKLEGQSKRTGDRALQIRFLTDAREQTRRTSRRSRRYRPAPVRAVQQLPRSTWPPRPGRLGQPTYDNRLKLMAAAPVGVLAVVLGAVHADGAAGRPGGRPGRPDGPGPAGRPGRRPAAAGLARPAGALRRAAKTAVRSRSSCRASTTCGSPSVPAVPTAAGSRCVLITSACGGEGKTTLAAQLAGRCANAGLPTLLVDADLRRPPLGELLEVPEGPGLADVLAGEARAEGAMVVIGDAGGFHLLPAGTPGRDPSRLLQGEPARPAHGPAPGDLRRGHRRRPAGPGRAGCPAARPLDRRGGAGRPPRHQPVSPGRAGQPPADRVGIPVLGRGGQRRAGRWRTATALPATTPTPAAAPTTVGPELTGGGWSVTGGGKRPRLRPLTLRRPSRQRPLATRREPAPHPRHPPRFPLHASRSTPPLSSP